MKLSELDFPTEQSEYGAGKLRMLHEMPVILPHFDGAKPTWRVSWEWLQDYISTSVPRHAALMREMPVNGQAGDHFEKMEGMVNLGQAFADALTSSLAAQFDDYNPAFGFDIDLFLMVHTDFQQQTATTDIHCEVFPRQVYGERVAAFASRVVLDGQWYEAAPPPGSKADYTLNGLVVSERVAAGEDFEQVYRTFAAFQGMWELRAPTSHVVFVSRMIYSLLAPQLHGEVVGGNARFVEGEAFKASVVRFHADG